MSVLSLSGGLAMDLGTANTLIYEKGKGIVLNEPSMVAVETDTRRVLAIGREAKSYLGRTPAGLEVVRPLQCGVISDFAVTQQMIRGFLTMAGANRRLFKPRIVIGVPIGVTQVEKRAIIEAAESAGGKSINLVDEPLAAAVGMGLAVEEPVARLVLDVGGGTSEGVLVSLGAIAFSESRRVAGDEATRTIARYLRSKYDLAVGENMAEHIKMTIGSAMPLEEIRTFSCRGKELSRGVPKVVELTSDDIREALTDIIDEFINMVKRLVTQAPPELAADLVKYGVYLTGGGSLLKGLDRRLSNELGLEVNVPEEPLLSVALGLGRILENVNYYRTVFVS